MYSAMCKSLHETTYLILSPIPPILFVGEVIDGSRKRFRRSRSPRADGSFERIASPRLLDVIPHALHISLTPFTLPPKPFAPAASMLVR